MLNQYGKDFIKILDNIKYSKNRYELFNDWLTMAAASLYSTWKNDKAVEEEYLFTAKQYKPEETEQFSQLLELTVNALEEKEQDFLGEVFTYGELSNSKNGQFFTPYNISYMMADMLVGDTDCPNRRVLRVSDPCCGAGGMLIASAAVMKKHEKINYQQDVLFQGIDIDPRCARMAFIQMSLLGAPAVITCGNSLTMETYWYRETIGYHMASMDFRLRAEKMFDIITQPQTEPQEEREKETIIKLPPARELVQGELF
jgi:type I restriction-modification system DNA methylase subunit